MQVLNVRETSMQGPFMLPLKIFYDSETLAISLVSIQLMVTLGHSYIRELTIYDAASSTTRSEFQVRNAR